MESIYNSFYLAYHSGLLWHEIVHALFALPFCLILWNKTKSWKHAIIPLIVAYLMDFDHLFDYWGYYGFGFDLVRFFKMDYFHGPGRALVPFHAYEWVLILALLSIKLGWKSYITAIVLGLIAHLIWDTISVGNILFYSILYRYSVGFRLFT